MLRFCNTALPEINMQGCALSPLLGGMGGSPMMSISRYEPGLCQNAPSHRTLTPFDARNSSSILRILSDHRLVWQSRQ